MKIYSMTATFGKLDGETIYFQSGLNVVSAPNEWGKSTWCGFLVAMLYGIETSQRTSSKGLADKERYAPWSGKPMSGRIDLCWQGKDITIERSNKGRSIFGNFHAYETHSGLPICELTADNCGQTLLGVEKSVFIRSAFIRFSDMPVTQDDALRRRLNALVTTGDESGASDDLSQKLRDLKNRCRHNKTGLLPQAESQKKNLEDKLTALQSTQVQICKTRQTQESLENEIRLLKNHQEHLAYTQETQKTAQVEAAKDAYHQALDILRRLEMASASLPNQEYSQKKLVQAQRLQEQWNHFQEQPLPQQPEPSEPFAGMSQEQALIQAKSDRSAYDMLQKPVMPLLVILTVILAVATIPLAFLSWSFAFCSAFFALFLFILYWRNRVAKKRDREALCRRYGVLPADQWIPVAQRYAQDQQDYTDAMRAYQSDQAALKEQTEALTGDQSLAEYMEQHRQVLIKWQALADAQQNVQRTELQMQAMAAMVKKVTKPTTVDSLTLDAQQTHDRIAQAEAQLQALRERLGQYKGQAETHGSEDVLQRELATVLDRIQRLEAIFAAVTLAQNTLADAANELQRRFAPRIAQQATELFREMTGGRYDRLILDGDLSLQAGASGENTLRTAQWRSDGTADQIYLSLRLAVASELIPDAPLVLDDALVRFDDARLKKVMTLLKNQAQNRQVILFTCQNREQQFI